MPIDEQRFVSSMLAAGFTEAEAEAWWGVEHPWGEQRLLIDEANDLRTVGLVGPGAAEWFVERIAPKIAREYARLGWSAADAGVLHRALQPSPDPAWHEWRWVPGETDWLNTGMPVDQVLVFALCGMSIDQAQAWLDGERDEVEWLGMVTLASLARDEPHTQRS